MPVFDQPDLKAKWTFTAIIPVSWDAISNEFVEPEATDRAEKGMKSSLEVSTLFG